MAKKINIPDFFKKKEETGQKAIRRNVRLGDLLVESKFITENQLILALEIQKTSKKKLGEVLVDENIIAEMDLIEALKYQLNIPYIDFSEEEIQEEAVKLLTEEEADKYNAIPVKIQGDKVLVAMVDPLNILFIEDLEIITKKEVIPAISTRRAIATAIDEHYRNKRVERELEKFSESKEASEVVVEEISREIQNAPVVQLIDSIIGQAVARRASDIHIEPFEKNVKIRFRIDGDLREVSAIAKNTHASIVTRIKIMGSMNITEKRIPQDGRIETEINDRKIDLRVSSLPTIYGEKVVMRIFDKEASIIPKEELGFTEKDLGRFNEMLKNPNGIILITGPTGSGKSTTLYSILNEMNDPTKNIITVEDPVEFQLAGVNQVQVSEKANLTFANALRSILRQDPDKIMIGEIRDSETAEISIRAAITGHLVLSTMHTNDTASTVDRLIDMGVESYIVGSSLVGVVAQRLVKMNCPDCLRKYKITEEEKKLLRLNKDVVLAKGVGCQKCGNSGYKGRMAVYEIMEISSKMREMIGNGEKPAVLKKTSQEEGMSTLFENARRLALQGITTVEEVLRIAYSLD